MFTVVSVDWVFATFAPALGVNRHVLPSVHDVLVDHEIVSQQIKGSIFGWLKVNALESVLLLFGSVEVVLRVPRHISAHKVDIDGREDSDVFG